MRNAALRSLRQPGHRVDLFPYRAGFPVTRWEVIGRRSSGSIRTRGITGEAAGFEERHILQLVLAIGVKTLSNYSNHLFHTPVDPVFARRAWED